MFLREGPDGARNSDDCNGAIGSISMGSEEWALRGQPLLAGEKPCFQARFNYFPTSAIGLVAQLVEQCPFNSKTPVLAIFSSF